MHLLPLAGFPDRLKDSRFQGHSQAVTCLTENLTSGQSLL